MRCSNLHLTEIPQDIPNDTRRLYLDYNLLTIIPANAFNDLPLLAELDISHNELALLEPGAFTGLAVSLQFLDLSSNQLTTLDPDAFEGVRARSNLTGNPWHCDCRAADSPSTPRPRACVFDWHICQTSEPSDSGAQVCLSCWPKTWTCVCCSKDHGRGHVGDHVWMVHHGSSPTWSTMWDTIRKMPGATWSISSLCPASRASLRSLPPSALWYSARPSAYDMWRKLLRLPKGNGHWTMGYLSLKFKMY